MRSNSRKVLGGAGIVAAVITVCIFGRSSRVASEPIQPDVPEPPIGDVEPGQSYGLGPNAIPYEAQTTAEQDNIDRIYKAVEADHPRSASRVFSRAAAQAVVEAKAQVATNLVGLQGVEEQGVVP